MAEKEVPGAESSIPEVRAGFLLRLLRILIAAAIGNILLAAGAFLMRIDSRPACLGGLAVVLLATLVVFVVVAWQMSASSAARRALLSCALIWMVTPPMASWLCEILYWHVGTTGTILAFAVVVPAISALVAWGSADCLRAAGLWEHCKRPLGLALAAFLALWAVNAFQLATISLNWNIVPLPKVKLDSTPAAISRLLTGFLPTTLLLVFMARRVVYLSRRANAAPASESS